MELPYDWYEDVYEVFKSELFNTYGIEATKMYFRGFWSQGDGAMFEGYVYDWGKLLPHVGIDNPVIHELATDEFSVKASQYGHYCHSHSIYFNFDISDVDDWEFACPYKEGDIRRNAWLIITSQLDVETMMADIEDLWRDLSGELYRRLEAEYDYLTEESGYEDCE